jgi:alpha-beta hydrolase superfamily lysophospholipase
MDVEADGHGLHAGRGEPHPPGLPQPGQFLASLGCPVYALDRRGSGMSRELRGHCSDFREMVADISFVCEYVMNRHRVAKVHVVGHCFGAIPACVFACQYPDKVETLVLTTPGIYTHSDLSLWQKLSIFLWKIEGRVCYIPVPLDVDEFSDLEPYRRFIREDPLAVTAATSEFYFEVHRARLFLKANDGNMRFFMALPSQQKRLLMYADAIHILEFSHEREAFFADLADWIRYAGASSGRTFSP